MSRFVLLAAATAFALSGCGTGEDNESANATNAMPQSRTENGEITARVQGVDLKVNLPPPIRRMTEDNDYFYPGARTEGDDGRRFHSDDPPERVAAWYRDTAHSRISIAGVERQGPAFILTGSARNGDALRIRLFPGAQGGTDGTVVVTARN